MTTTTTMLRKDDKQCFSDGERCCLNGLFRDAILKLKLVKHILNHEIAASSLVLNDHRIKMKMETCHRQINIPLENYMKAATKRKDIAHILQETLREINDSGNFSLMRNYVDEEKRRCEKEEALFVTEGSLKETISSLKKDLIAMQERTEKEIGKKDEEIISLKTKFQLLKREFKKSESTLIDESRQKVDGVRVIYLNKENQLKLRVEEIRRSTEEEGLSHLEIIRYLQAWESELQNQISYWNQKLENDVKDIDRKIENATESISVIKERKSELNAKCEEFEKVIIEDKLEKELKRQAEMEKIKEASAIKIQKWWRQILSLHMMKMSKKRHKKSKKREKQQLPPPSVF